jgi:hypothetical protein
MLRSVPVLLLIVLPFLPGCAAFERLRGDGLAERDGNPGAGLRRASETEEGWSLTKPGSDVERNLGVGG